MYLSSRNRYSEELPKENVQIWSCTKEGCKGWMRNNFAFKYEPDCCLCLSPMVSGTRMLPVLVNSEDELKAIRKALHSKAKAAALSTS